MSICYKVLTFANLSVEKVIIIQQHVVVLLYVFSANDSLVDSISTNVLY
jgi:hypothetical protein